MQIYLRCGRSSVRRVQQYCGFILQILVRISTVSTSIYLINFSHFIRFHSIRLEPSTVMPMIHLSKIYVIC